jgi:glucose/arabinose dehydrogenase
MKTVTAAVVSTLSVAIVTVPALAQEAENPPTLKLDRIPSMPAFAGQTRAPAAPVSTFEVETVAGGLSTPWALAFLPGGGILVTEYTTGTMRIVEADGSISAPIAGLPEISHEGWAGLFDVTLDPDFGNNHYLYFSYSAPSGDPESPNIPRVARAELDRDALRLDEIEVLLDGDAWQELHFGPDGKLYVSGTSTASGANSQDLSTHSGKLLRIDSDGGIPRDNPWSANEAVPSEILTLGHRDISGIATHPGTGDLWVTEHGARGGDEVNVIRAGANYGWPVISYGTNYTGEPVGDGQTAQPGMEQPLYFWRPSIAPSGLMFYTGDMFPEWRGNLFVTALAGQHISRLVLEDDRVVAEERLLADRKQRIRELRQGPDGALYALTNEESDAPKGFGELLRITR